MVTTVSASVGQASLSRWLQTPADNSYEVAILQSRNGPLEPLPLAVLAHVVALTDALDADRGMRARAVHLVIVEQTLKQRIFGGLDAIPVPVLKQAAVQLPRLSRFRASPELQLLLRCMRGTIEDNEIPVLRSVLHSGTEFIDVSSPAGMGAKEVDALGEWRPGEPHSSERAQGEVDMDSSDDGFPDTCSPDECDDVPLPMPSMDRGAAKGMGKKWR